ncbi:hypothetical protein SAMN04488499_1003221 [Sporomusa acidovorans]|nr:hypothetical protein SPACI_31330 [Sporomusa acidovorans DSM 3132]SDD74099.1 hypothetical protein SAMN04488499_1003221 [Sporomusa acidovorans]
MIEQRNIPAAYRKFGESIDDIFRESKHLRYRYQEKKTEITPGAIGVYSYIHRLKSGMRLFMTLNRKFDLKYIDQSDVIPLTQQAEKFLNDLN